MTTSFFYPYISGSNGTEAACNYDVLATIQLGQSVQTEGRATTVSPLNNEAALMQVSIFEGSFCNQRFVTAAVIPLRASGGNILTHLSLSVTRPRSPPTCLPRPSNAHPWWSTSMSRAASKATRAVFMLEMPATMKSTTPVSG